MYHNGTPLFGSQTLRFKILNADKYFSEIYDGILPLSPFSTLNWFGFSEGKIILINLDGILISYDSDKIIRGFSLGISKNWIPLMDLKELYPNSSFWIIGVQDEEVYGIELKAGITEPQVNVRAPLKVHKLKVPLLHSDTYENEEKIIIGKFFTEHETWRSKTYGNLKDLRSTKMPEHYYSDSIKDDSDLNTIKKDFDKYLLGLMQDYVTKNQLDKILDVFDSLYLQKSREIAIKFAEALNENNLVQTMLNKFARWKLANEQTLIEKPNNFSSNLNSTSKATTKLDDHAFESRENIETNEHNIFNSYALNSDNFKNLEEEVRNEMRKNGIVDMEENDNEKFNSHLPLQNLESQLTVN